MDIKGYFMAMDRNILYQRIGDVLKNKKEKLGVDIDFALYLLKKIIFNDPSKNCVIKGKKENWIGLPKSKVYFMQEKARVFPSAILLHNYSVISILTVLTILSKESLI